MPFLAPIWLPFGLLDRQMLAPPRLSDTIEIDGGGAVSSTLHAQAPTGCDCNLSAYGTLPLAVSDDSRATVGTVDVGLIGGTREGRGQHVYRVGFLVPSASREQMHMPASARVGDDVLALPRSTGVRLGHSRIWIKDTPWTSIAQHILRVDVGLDIAGQYATGDVHVIPRTAIGVMQQCDLGSFSFETALAYDPLADDGGMRWSGGVTGMLKLGWLQPAATLAAVRTPDGWGGTLALDLAAVWHRRSASSQISHDD